MTPSTTPFPVQPLARLAGALYLLIIAAGLFAQAGVHDVLIVPADAAATAANIRAQPMLLRLGIAADLSTFLCAIPLTVILYVLLERVNRPLALIMLLSNLAQCAVGGMNVLNSYRALQLLGGAGYLDAFGPEQLQALAMLALRAHTIGFGIAMSFFGVSCLALGALVFRAGFLPRTLGVLVGIAGACYLLGSTLLILAPARASMLIVMPALAGELGFALWLVFRGVDLARWRERASA